MHTYGNNIIGTVQNSGGLSSGGTNLLTDATSGAKIIAIGFPCFITIWGAALNPNTDPNMEIVLATANPSGYNFTIARAQQSTSGVSHANGDNIAVLFTAANLNDFIPPVTLANAVTLTNKRITKRVLALSAGSATPSIDTDTYDVVHITAQNTAITSFTSGLSGTPVDGDTLRISVTDSGTAETLTWGTSFEPSGNTVLPVTTVISTRLDIGFFWNTETNKWRCVAVS